MKRVYESPMMFVEEFAANEYIAACGETNDEYKFKCDAMGGITGAVFYSDGDDKWEPVLTGILGGDRLMGTGYHACGESHITQVGDEFIEGWYVTGWDGISGGDWVQKVKIWKGPDGNNIHCTTTLDEKHWETAKS